MWQWVFKIIVIPLYLLPDITLSNTSQLNVNFVGLMLQRNVWGFFFCLVAEIVIVLIFTENQWQVRIILGAFSEKF